MRARSTSRLLRLHEWVCRRERAALKGAAGALTAVDYVAWRNRCNQWRNLASICIQSLGGAR